MSQDDIERFFAGDGDEDDETRVTVQRRERPSYADQEVLFVNIYDNIDGFGTDYSQHQFLITEEDDARRVRYMQKSDRTVPPRLAVEAVHEAGFEVEGLDEQTDSKTMGYASDLLRDTQPNYEESPVTANLNTVACSLAVWNATIMRRVLDVDGPIEEGRWSGQGIETEEDLFRHIHETPEDAMRFWNAFGQGRTSETGNDLAVAVLRLEVLKVYGFDLLEHVPDAPDRPDMPQYP